MIKESNKRITITLSEEDIKYLERLMTIKGITSYTRAIKLLIDLYKISTINKVE